MNATKKQAFIKQKALENQQNPLGTKVLWSRHAIVEAVKDNLSRKEVEESLLTAKIIENYPLLHRSLPDCLVLGFLRDNKPLHVVIAIDVNNDRIFIVTVYLPAEDKWDDDWQTRK